MRIIVEEVLRTAMSSLSDEERTIVEWRWLQRLGYPTIAERLGIGLQRAQKRGSRAMARLREIIETEGFRWVGGDE